MTPSDAVLNLMSAITACTPEQRTRLHAGLRALLESIGEQAATDRDSARRSATRQGAAGNDYAAAHCRGEADGAHLFEVRALELLRLADEALSARRAA